MDDLAVTAGRWPQWSLEYRAQGPWMGFYFLTNLLRQGHSTMTCFPVLADRSHQGVPLLPPSWPPGVLCITPALALEPSCQASHLLVPSSHTPLPWSSTHTRWRAGPVCLWGLSLLDTTSLLLSPHAYAGASHSVGVSRERGPLPRRSHLCVAVHWDLC